MKAEKQEFDKNADSFTDFMRRLVAVPHSEIRAKLDAEKAAKKRKPKPSASRASASSPKGQISIALFLRPCR